MTSSQTTQLPPTHRALLLRSTRDPYDMAVVMKDTPQAGPGSAVIKILGSGVLTYANRVYSGKKPYPYPTPFVPGSFSIARVAAVGPDATTLEIGQLVFFDCFIHGRDDNRSLFLHGLSAGFNPGSNRLMENEWKDGTYAEYAKVPLENCFPLDEARLLGKPEDGGLGYSLEHLMYMFQMSVPFGGLRDVDVKTGDKVAIAPAAGAYGSAAVVSALAMGAYVIAIGRDLETLEKVKALSPSGRVRAVQITGDTEKDIEELTKDGPLDVFFDISPGQARESTHFKSCIESLRRGGRISIMGFMDLALPTSTMMLNDITLKGKWMYQKEDIRYMIKLLEAGYMDLHHTKTVGTFSIEEFAEAFDTASKMKGPFLQTIIVP